MASQLEQDQKSAPAAAPPAEADEFAALLKQNFKPRTERAATEVENAVQTLVTQALADTTVIKGEVLDTIEEMIARQVPAMAKLLAAREQLSNLLKYMDGKVAAEGALKKLLADPDLMAAMKSRLEQKPASAEFSEPAAE